MNFSTTNHPSTFLFLDLRFEESQDS